MSENPAEAREPIDVVGLFPQVQLIKDPALRRGVIATWQELWSMSTWARVEQVPTGPEIAYPAIPHNQAVMTIALAIADVFERFHGAAVDRDCLIAAAALQDASKVIEYVPGNDGIAIAGPLGRDFPHGFWAAHVALRHDVSHAVVHILLTHASSSSVFPSSLEGKILYYADQIDVIGIYKDRWRKQVVIAK